MRLSDFSQQFLQLAQMLVIGRRGRGKTPARQRSPSLDQYIMLTAILDYTGGTDWVRCPFGRTDPSVDRVRMQETELYLVNRDRLP